ncbi:unnamed protein product [Musa acuminata subsp. burmannicoides]
MQEILMLFASMNTRDFLGSDVFVRVLQNKSPASSNRFPPDGSQRIFLFALVHSRTRGVTTRNRVGGKETWGAHEGAPSDNGTVENCSSCNPRRRYDQIHIHTYTFTRT